MYHGRDGGRYGIGRHGRRGECRTEDSGRGQATALPIGLGPLQGSPKGAGSGGEAAAGAGWSASPGSADSLCARFRFAARPLAVRRKWPQSQHVVISGRWPLMRREYGSSLWWRLFKCWIRCNRRRSHRAACRDSVHLLETGPGGRQGLVAEGGAGRRTTRRQRSWGRMERGWDNHQNRW